MVRIKSKMNEYFTHLMHIVIVLKMNANSVSTYIDYLIAHIFAYMLIFFGQKLRTWSWFARNRELSTG